MDPSWDWNQQAVKSTSHPQRIQFFGMDDIWIIQRLEEFFVGLRYIV